MRTGDGNESDKAVFAKILGEFKKQLQLDSILVADSALYSQENLQLMKEMKWITRVPLTLKKARELIKTLEIEEVFLKKEMSEAEKERVKKLKKKGYKWSREYVTYGGIKQRWLIVESEARKISAQEKLEDKIEQEFEKVMNNNIPKDVKVCNDILFYYWVNLGSFCRFLSHTKK